MNGRPLTRTSGLGVVSVIGASLVPNPPARMTALARVSSAGIRESPPCSLKSILEVHSRCPPQRQKLAYVCSLFLSLAAADQLPVRDNGKLSAGNLLQEMDYVLR